MLLSPKDENNRQMGSRIGFNILNLNHHEPNTPPAADIMARAVF